MEVPTAACSEVVANLVDRIFNLIWTKIARVFKWEANVKNLEKKVQKLAAERESVLQSVEAAARRGEEVVLKVKNWQIDADKYIDLMKKLGDDKDKAGKKCCLGVCPNPRVRYQISKKVEEYLDAVTQLLEEAGKFKIPDSYCPPQKGYTVPVKGFEDFGSRMSVLDLIMEALRSASIDKIGVHGMPGVGKTMLAKEVARRAEEAHLFDAIVMASVTKNQDLRRIQGEIADRLDLQLHGETEFGRANQLKAYLKKKKRILVILDDIWMRLDLDEVGIPFEEKKNEASSIGEEQMQCKILCTSRSLNVLSRDMVINQNFEVRPLHDEEAWELLKKIVGSEIEKSELRSTAMDIAKECAGLPLGIQTLGNSLKGKISFEWSDALIKLKRPSPENFVGISAKVYSAIELSYEHLEGEELKQTFLLCSLLGQNASIEDLLKYGIGLGLFHNVSTLGEARVRALTLLSNLKSSSLLLDGYSNIHFDMHDIVRDVAISIASRDNHVLSLIDDNIPKRWLDREAMGDIKWISLQHANISELPDELECSQLTLFYLFSKDPSMKIPENFFRGMPNLRVLDFTEVHFSSLPSSICLLKKLRTLQMNRSVIKDIACIGELICLEVLSLSGSDIEELPTKLGQLTQLKFLDLSDCTKLRVIQPHVLASLSRLEELYMGNSFNKWEPDGHGNQRNASLAELKDLHSLTALDVHVCDVQLMPEDLFCERLKRYKIFIGEVWKQWDSSFKSSKILKLELNTSISYDHSIGRLLKKTEEIHLEALKGVKNVVYELDVEGFQELRYFYVQNAPEVQYIINSTEWSWRGAMSFSRLEVLSLRNLNNLVKICHGRLGTTCFNRLRIITVECCNQLKNLFPFSIARQLLQLEEIRVTDCSDMLKIVAEEGQGATNDIAEANENLELAKLRSLKLQYLPKFLVLCHGNEGKTVSSSKCGPLFNEKIVFPNLEELKLSLLNIESIWSSQLSTKSCCIRTLTKLIIEGCDHLEHLLSSSMAKCLVQLTYLEIKKCKRMREIIAPENAEEMEDLILFPKLNILRVNDLENLSRFCSGNYSIEFTTLKELFIRNCPELRGFMVNTGTDVTDGLQPLFNEKAAFPSLEQLVIWGLVKLRIIWHHQLPADSFCKLKKLIILYCDKLLNIFPSYMLARLLTSVEKLEVGCCGSLEEIFELGELNVEESHAVVNTQLRELAVGILPRLKHLWSKDPCGIFSFRNLQTVVTVSCQNLQNMFPASVARGLQQLEVLKIQFCTMMEEVVALMEEGNEAVPRFALPRLSTLELWGLLRLKYFYPGKHIIECPKLKDFCACECGSFTATKGERLGKFPVQLPLFSIKEVIPQLEKLSLTSDDIAMISNGQFPRDLFSNVKVLRLLSYKDDESPVFPIHFLQCFRKLEKLHVAYSNFKELFPNEGDADGQEKCVGTQLHIIELELVSLGNLRHICNQDSGGAGLILQNLKILKVKRCNGLISLSASKTPFCNLNTLVVDECQGLINLVSFSTAHQSLVQLETISITACHSLTEIVGDERNGLEDEIVFMKLKVLKLIGLTKLTSFCSRLNFTFKFQSLEHLVVRQCPNMETFCKGVVKTPLLQRISLEHYDHGRPVGDLNSTIKQLYKEEVGYAGLSHLKLSEFPKLMERWNKNPQDILDFRRILYLEICNCDSLRYLLTPSMVLSLSHLSEIKVQNCKMIEQIITKEEAIEVPENKMIFPQLHFINLKSCPNLTSFIVGSYKLECPSLVVIEMANCPKMVTFSSTFSIVQEKETTARGSEEMLGKESLDIPTETFFSDQVVFPSLAELSISKMGSLIKIWDEQLDEDSFHKLYFLCVVDCEKLLTIFPINMVGRLQNLGVLHINNCVSLEEIFEPQGLSADESQAQITAQSALVKTTPNFVFSEVTSLSLRCLPNLKSFHSQIHTTEWPSLKKLDMIGCGKVQILASELLRTSGENQLEIQIECPLFWVSKASFPNLEELIVEENDDLKEIWHGDVNDGIIFTKLKSLQLNHLPRLASFCLGNCNFEFPSLKEVIVKGCPNMMTFSGGEVRAPNLQKVKFTKDEDEVEECWAGGLNDTIQQFVHEKKVGHAGLRHLKLSEFPKLREIWNQNPQDILDFRRILTLEICNCTDSLRYLLTPSMVLSLTSLKKIKVQNCEMIGQIITQEEAIEVPEKKIIFPRLYSLTVKSCPNLTSFIVGSYKLECPSLLVIKMANCPKMVTFSSTFSIVQEKETTGGGSEEMLRKEILDISTEPFFSDQVVFPRLGVLSISEIGSLIKIWDEQLHEDSFHKLCSLSVEYCEKLLNIFPVNMVGRLQNLGKLLIRNCVSLEEIFEPQGLSADESQAQITAQSALVETTPNFVFPEVTSLDLWWLPNLKSFYSQIHTTEWPSLKKLDMTGCDKVQILASELSRTSGENQLEIQIERPLFWVSKATFPNLEKLIVERNDDLKEIWHGEDDVKNDIIFTKLKSLQLNHLPRLASFCLGNCNFEFPSLKDVIVMGCPNMMTFSGGEVSTPNLQKVKVTKDDDEDDNENEDEDEDDCKDDNGDEENDNDEDEDEDENEDEGVEVSTPNLQEVKLSKDEGVECLEGGLNPTIQQLFAKMVGYAVVKHVKLSHFLELMGIRSKKPQEILNFRWLCFLEICNCSNLRYLLTLSMALSLVSLKKMKVQNCEMLEQVISEEVANLKDGIVFSKLQSLELKGLPRLVSFCLGNFNFEFTSLEDVIVMACPYMLTFSGGELSTPKLHKVKLTGDEDEGCWEGSLNPTIQLLFTKKSVGDSKED